MALIRGWRAFCRWWSTWLVLVGSTIKKRQRLNEIAEIIKSTIPGVVGAAPGVVYTRGHWLK